MRALTVLIPTVDGVKPSDVCYTTVISNVVLLPEMMSIIVFGCAFCMYGVMISDVFCALSPYSNESKKMLIVVLK